MDTDQWMTPQEASLEISVRRGYLVTTDALRQLKRTGKIPMDKVKQFNRQVSLYNRAYILDSLPAPKRPGSGDIDVKHTVFWLENYGERVEHLLRIGFSIDCIEEARAEVQRRAREKEDAKINR